MDLQLFLVRDHVSVSVGKLRVQRGKRTGLFARVGSNRRTETGKIN